MTTNKKVNGTAASMPIGIALGAAVSVGVTGILAALLTWLALKGVVSEASIGYFALGILLVGAVVGPLLAAVKIKRRWVFVCCLTGVIYFLTLMASTAVFFGSNYQGIGTTGVAVLVGTLAASLVGLKKGSGHRKGFKKYRTC